MGLRAGRGRSGSLVTKLSRIARRIRVTINWPHTCVAEAEYRVAMDLYKAIQDLYAEKEKLERVIASLEELQRTSASAPMMPGVTRRRGRKSMGDSERAEVSERMKKYWANRRKDSANHRPERDARATN